MIILDSLRTRLAALKAWAASKLTAKAQFWHQLWSVRIMIATAFYSAAATAWRSGVIPYDWKPHLSHTERVILAGIGMLLPGIAAVSVVVKQSAVDAAVEARRLATVCHVPAPLAPTLPPEAPHGNDPA